MGTSQQRVKTLWAGRWGDGQWTLCLGLGWAAFIIDDNAWISRHRSWAGAGVGLET